MTTKTDLSPEEWQLVLEGPPTAGMIVITAAAGGSFRETFAMTKAYSEARAQHGASQLLDEIVTARPQLSQERYRSPDELRDKGLQHIRAAMTPLEGKATAQEVDDYRHFVLALATKVAAAHREEGQGVSVPETEAIAQIAAALGTTAP